MYSCCGGERGGGGGGGGEIDEKVFKLVPLNSTKTPRQKLIFTIVGSISVSVQLALACSLATQECDVINNR